MAEEHEKKEERDDADAGTLLKTVIDRLDSLHKRMDAMEEKEEPEPVAADKKKDSEEKEEEKEERKDAKEKDEDDSTVFYRGNKAPKKDSKKDSRSDEGMMDEDEEEKPKKKADTRRKDASEEKDDSRKKDDDDTRRKDARKMKREDEDEEEEEEEEEREDDDARAKKDDDSRADSFSSVRRRIDRVERMLPKQLSDSDRAAYSDVQASADEIYHAFGKSAPAPMQGEGLMAYRQRIVTKLKEHSPTWKDVNIYAIADDKGFEAVERTVYSDALGVAHSPATVEPGTLRMITNMSGGHEIHTFEGEARAWMDSMAGPVRMHVTSINTPNGSAR